MSPGSSESSPTHGAVIELAKTEGRDPVKCLVYTRTRAPFEKGKTSSPGRTKGRFVGSDVLPHQAKLLGVCPKEFSVSHGQETRATWLTGLFYLYSGNLYTYICTSPLVVPSGFTAEPVS